MVRIRSVIAEVPVLIAAGTAVTEVMETTVTVAAVNVKEIKGNVITADIQNRCGDPHPRIRL